MRVNYSDYNDKLVVDNDDMMKDYKRKREINIFAKKENKEGFIYYYLADEGEDDSR